MALTRANVEAILVKRCGGLLAAAGMAVTVVGSNADLNDPIGWAVRQAGYTVSDISSVADGDLSGVSSDDVDAVLDAAEFRTLESILGNLDDVDMIAGPRSEKLSQLAEQVRHKLERMARQLGFNVATLEKGLLTFEFAEHDSVN